MAFADGGVGVNSCPGCGVRLGRFAAHHLCADCGTRAQHWSYDHNDTEEIRDDMGLPYGSDASHYSPRCVSCHKRFDLAMLQQVAA
jgi:ribosomal protein L32